MTNLEALIELAKKKCPSFTVDWGFEADIEEFLLSELTVGDRIVFIAVGAHVPLGPDEDGNGVVWQENFSITLRSEASGRRDVGFYNEFIALRDALPGYVIPGTDRYVEVLSAAPGISRGGNEATLSLQI